MKEQKINLINCEKIQAPEVLQNSSSQIRCNIPVKIKIIGKKPSVVNIYKTESIVKIKQVK